MKIISPSGVPCTVDAVRAVCKITANLEKDIDIYGKT